MDAVYYYGQDGEIADQTIKTLFALDENELRWSKRQNASVFEVVGFVFKGDHILAVFPKHYYSREELARLNASHEERSHDIRLLYGVIKKYSEGAGAAAQAYMGAREGYDSDYPFKAFYEVYDYFQRYGLYKEREEKTVSGSSGSISWKKTLEKSQKIVSGGNLIFTPLYVRKKNYNTVFITECMAFIIDYTIERFRCFISLKKTGHARRQFDYWENVDLIISKLNQNKNRMFKDIHKKLIESMIHFFEQYRHRMYAEGGKIHVRTRNFDMIWQDMAGKYLNEHFVCMDPAEDRAVFDSAQRTSPVKFQTKSYSDIDDSSHHFYISIDHAAYENRVLYILDSKYYFESNSLNYKQFSYSEILRYHYPGAAEIYNMLLLPGRDGSKLHFSLSAGYAGSRTTGIKIIEQYLEPKSVMENYMESI